MALRPALVASLLLHAAAGAGLIVCARLVPREPAFRRVELGLVEPRARVVALPAGRPVQAPAGAADFLTTSPASPFPRADVEVAGRRAAAPGGSGTGGTPSDTGRRDREELRAQPWNDHGAYRLPRERTARDRATSEALPRVPDPGIDGSLRQPRSRAREAAPADRPEGLLQGTRAVAGQVAASAARPLVATGPAATEAPRHGRSAPTPARPRPPTSVTRSLST